MKWAPRDTGLSVDKQKKLWGEARQWFQKSSDNWRQIKNPGVMSPGGFNTVGADFVKQSLADCDAALKRLT
jgi:hypothetical protein